MHEHIITDHQNDLDKSCYMGMKAIDMIQTDFIIFFYVWYRK